MTNKEPFSEEAQQLNTIIKTATDGIIIINHLGIIERVNVAATQLFGYLEKELIGQNVNILMPMPFMKNHDSYIQSYLETGVKKIIGIGREVEGKKKDGTLFPLRLSISEVKLDNRIIFTGILHDLSQQKAQEERIKKLNSELEKRVEERTIELGSVVNRLLGTNKQLQHEIKERKGVEKTLRQTEQEIRLALKREQELGEIKTRFVTMASHEFRTPLSSILASAELIEAYTLENEQDKRVRNVKRITNAVNNLTNILNEFLSFSKLEEGQLKYRPTIFLFDEFAIRLIDELKVILKTGQQINFQGLGKDKNITLDQSFLRHILFNLLSNAIKYSGKGQPVDFIAQIKNDQFQIVIKDQGIGIPEEDQAHLFTRFFRAYNVENIQGTGLGLNIVKKYVDLMDGNIDFSSQLEQGSSFIITIPLRGK